MPVTGFVLPTAGFLQPLPANAREEITRRFPNLDLKKVERAYSFYIISRDGRSDHPSPKDARKQLSDLRRRATELSKAFSDLGPLRHTVWEAAASLDRHDEIDQIETMLAVFEETVGTAEEMIPRGRPVSAHTVLVRELAAIIEKSGMPVDVKAGGILTTVTAILLEHSGEKPSSASKIVSDSFGGRRTKPVAG